MNRRLMWLAVAPFFFVGALVGTLLCFPLDTAGRVMTALAPLGHITTMVAAAWAAWQIGFGDRLGRAWALNAAGSTIGLISMAAFGVSFHGTASTSALIGRTAASVLINIAGPAAAFLFARVWSDTGLAPRGRTAATIVSVAVALAIAGKGTVADAMALSGGSLTTAASLISDLGDIISIGLLGSIFATALAMRGGSLVWMWGLLVASTLSWLLFDAGAQLAPSVRAFTDYGFALLAHLLLAAAALAHTAVIRGIRRSSVAP